MDDLVTWLRAELEDDERAVHETLFNDPCDRAGHHHDGWILADIDARRRILDLHGREPHECPALSDAWGSRTDYAVDCITVRLLALPYADHPGYRDEWKP